PCGRPPATGRRPLIWPVETTDLRQIQGRRGRKVGGSLRLTTTAGGPEKQHLIEPPARLRYKYWGRASTWGCHNGRVERRGTSPRLGKSASRSLNPTEPAAADGHSGILYRPLNVSGALDRAALVPRGALAVAAAADRGWPGEGPLCRLVRAR